MSAPSLALFLTAALAADPAGPAFRLWSDRPAPAAGHLAALDDDWSVRLDDPAATRVPGDRVVALRRAGVPRPGVPDQPQLVLTNGDRIAGLATAVADEKVTLRPADGVAGNPAVPIDVVAVMWLEAPDADLAAGRRMTDEVHLKNGDILRGTLVSLTTGQLALQTGDAEKPLTIDAGRVKAVAFSSDLARVPTVAGIRGRAVLANGSRLTLTRAHLADGQVEATTAAGPTLSLPLGQLVALDVFGGRADYLSDLKPAAYTTRPFHGAYLGLGLSWPLGTDRAPDGRPLRLAGGVVDRGLAMHSRSEVRYALDGRYRRFEAVVGFDERAGPRGRARPRVLLDGQPADAGLPTGRDFTPTDGPKTVSLDVSGAKELTLEVGFGGDGGTPHDARNHLVWADARLVK
jgi:hypothetical protein